MTGAAATVTVADWAGSWGVDGGTTTVIGVGGTVTWTVLDGMVTVALMAWPWSPTPETVMDSCGVVTVVFVRFVTAFTVVACLRTGEIGTVTAEVVTVTVMGMDGTVTVAGSPMVMVIGWLMTVAESVTGGTVTTPECWVTGTDVPTVPVVERARAAPTEIGAAFCVGVDDGAKEPEPPVGPWGDVEAAPGVEDEELPGVGDEVEVGSWLGTPETTDVGGLAADP